MKTIRIYGFIAEKEMNSLNENVKTKEQIKEFVNQLEIEPTNLKVKVFASKKRNLVGFEVYESGKSSLLTQVNFVEKKVKYFTRKKVTKVVPIAI